MAPYQNLTIRLIVYMLIIAAAACLVVALYGLQNRMPAGYFVDHWHVNGITYKEFEQQLNEQIKLVQQQPLRLVSEQPDMKLTTVTTTMEQLGLRVSLEDVLEPLTQLRSGSPWSRALSRWQLNNRHQALRYEFEPAVLHGVLLQQFPSLYAQQPSPAQRIVGPTDQISYIPDKHVSRIDETALLQQLRDAVRPLGKVSQAPSRSEESRGPVDIPLSFVTQNPELTLSILQAQGVDRKISEFSTPLLQTSEGRLHNVRSTASTIHDLLMKPGEVFDYATYITQTEARFGFQEAPVIVNGKLVPGIGGGICQVSSTLYNAVLRAGLAIVERRHHSLPVSYVALGQDATFAAGHINFQFRNSTDKYLLIRTSVDDRQMTVKLFGQIPLDTTYAIESFTIRTLQPEIRYVANPTLSPGKQQLISEGRPGYVVDTLRYKKQADRIIAQERISQDTYAAQPTIIAIYPSTSSGQPNPKLQPSKPYEAPLIEDGVKGPLYR
ncbi:Vancomycin resistance protein YoaR, contains peptidoglycan-binding and VanW domains [Paenibacillus sp. 1_12]|uniref:VanW family protein n=1 Tax=Paenibacillus sp. 1_12 TaxID=1566278 RepID=UPI0008E9D513|nr:VanW family protein [Paenibacillus sp. 1_12]SFL90099.1 Vancomycin resistance protein YoaR, contains peptidoglycan-binding and VanW domains [Paenibacillus sp. 1_12]